MEKSNPLPLAWMIHDDSTKLNPKLPLLLFFFLFFPKPSLLLSIF